MNALRELYDAHRRMWRAAAAVAVWVVRYVLRELRP